MKRGIIIVILIFINWMSYGQLDLALTIGKAMSPSCMENASIPQLEDYKETVWGISMEMIHVRGGTLRTYRLNSNDDNRGMQQLHDRMMRNPYDYVTVGSFYISRFEVTQELWEAVMGMGIEQSRDKAAKHYGKKLDLCGVGASYPMYYVSWEDATAFCDELSRKTGKKYRLPIDDEEAYALCNGSIIRQNIKYEENTASQRRIARRLRRNYFRESRPFNYGPGGRVCGLGFHVVCEP